MPEYPHGFEEEPPDSMMELWLEFRNHDDDTPD